MYSFADFETVKALPDVVTVKKLAEAIGISETRTYEILEEQKIPYMKIGARKIMFREHLLQGFPEREYSPMSPSLVPYGHSPRSFRPEALQRLWGSPMVMLTL